MSVASGDALSAQTAPLPPASLLPSLPPSLLVPGAPSWNQAPTPLTPMIQCSPHGPMTRSRPDPSAQMRKLRPGQGELLAHGLRESSAQTGESASKAHLLSPFFLLDPEPSYPSEWV